jgi:hypothetical protein
VEQNLRETADRLRATLADSRRDLHCAPEEVAAVVQAGLELGRQPQLVEEQDDESGDPVFRVPTLTGAWTRTVGELEDEDYGRRPISFDPGMAANRQDVVLAHLQHPLVAMATRLLRSEIWSGHHLSRVTAVTAPVRETVLAAWSRLVVVGADGNRLHEELFTAGGELRGTSFKRLGVNALAAVLDAAFGKGGATRRAPQRPCDELSRVWTHVAESLEKAIDARALERSESLTSALARRRRDEESRTRQLFVDFEQSLNAAVRMLETPQQQELRYGDLNTSERAQLYEDADAWRARLQRIPEEHERELLAIAARYETTRRLVFPAAVVLVVPGAAA